MTDVRPLKVARRCPRCRVHSYHSVPMRYRASNEQAGVKIVCAKCGHTWEGRLSKEERGIES